MTASNTERAPRVLVSGLVLGQPAGGVVRHNAELLPRVAQLLRDSGGGLGVLEGRVPIEFELPDFVERHRCNVVWLPTWRRALFEARALRTALREAAARGAPYDLVHIGHQPLPRDLGVPLTATVHDLRSVELRGGPRLRRALAPRIVGRGLRRAKHVFTVSETTRESLASRFALDPARITLVPNGVDHFEPLPRSPRLDGAAPLLHVGHVEPRKNLELVLRALALDTTLPPLCCLGLPKASERARLERIAHELSVSSRMTFEEGASDETVGDAFASASAVVLPSRLEGFGIVALEALRARVPLAVSDIPAHREVVGDHATTFAPDDARACAHAIRAAMTRSAEEIERGATHANRWSWDAAAQRWADAWCALTRTR